MSESESELVQELPEPSGVVYLLRSHSTGAIKIGYTSRRATERCADLTMHPGKLELVASVPATKRLESHIHTKLRDRRYYGGGSEWFLGEAEQEALYEMAQHGDVWMPPSRKEIVRRASAPKVARQETPWKALRAIVGPPPAGLAQRMSQKAAAEREAAYRRFCEAFGPP